MLVRRVLVFAAVLLAVFAVRPLTASAQTITVTTTADETTSNGQTSLREAFGLANTNNQNDTIQLQAGAHYILDFCAAGPLTHTAIHALTIQGGAGTTLQNTCSDSQTIVDTDNTAGLTINSLEMTGFFTDGGATVQGAAVRQSAGGTLVLNHVEIHGFSSGLGGSIVDGGDFGTNASILSSEIWGNQGTGVKISFGSLWLHDSQVHDITGNAVSLVDGTPVTISESSVNDNSGNGVTTSGQGNALLHVLGSTINGNGGVGLRCGACATVEITGSDIVGNGATATAGGGGGVAVTWDYDSPTDAPEVSITDSLIAYNRKLGPGGGVSVGFIEDSEPTATPGALNISGSNISGNGTESAVDLDGGGIYATSGNISIVDGSTINGNHAGPPGGTSGEGGGIWHRELADLDGSRVLTITDSTVSGNVANSKGGGVYAAHDGVVFVTRSTLNDNVAESGSGGALDTAGTGTVVLASKVQGNEGDVGGGLAHSAFSGLPAGSVSVLDSTVSGNTARFAASGGGGIFVNVAGVGAQTTVRNSTVTQNISPNFGGGIMVMQTSRLFLDHATVVDNTGANGSNVFVQAGQFRTRRAAIALPQGTGDNCAFFSSPSVTEGYSWADDVSCNLSGTDVEAPGVDPKLGALANNGGPTPTRKPQKTSPLVLVPAGSCTLPTDQRGTARPQGPKCEAGSVEINETAPK